MKTGWYDKNKYFVVKPLKNGCRQSLIMGAIHINGAYWYIMAGVFSCNATYHSVNSSNVWDTATSTNKNPSIKTLTLALEALDEIEQEIRNNANGKQRYIYVDGADERRLRVYTKVLTKKCGYKKSSRKSYYVDNMKILYKKI